MVWQNAFAVTTRMGSAKGRSKPMGLAAWVAIGFASGFAFGAFCHRVDACGEQGKCFYYPQAGPLRRKPHLRVHAADPLSNCTRIPSGSNA